MIQLISCKCPECKAELELNSSKEYAYCPYCGTKLLIHNDNISAHYEYKYQYKCDETKRAKIEADERIKNRKLDITEKNTKRKNISIILYVIFCAIMCLASFLCFLFAKSIIGAIVQTATLFFILLPIVLHITESIVKHDKAMVTSSSDSLLYGLIKSSYQYVNSPVKKMLQVWGLFFIIIFISFAFLAYPYYKDSISFFSYFSDSEKIGYSFAYYDDKERSRDIDSEEFGKKYAFLQNKDDLYEATILSKSTIQIKNYHLVKNDEKTNYEYDYDVCIIKTDNDEHAFSWVDDSHTAFLVTMYDEHNFYFRKKARICYSIIDENSDEWKNEGGSKGELFTYQNDSRNLYKAIELSEGAIKIEKWKKDYESDPSFYHASDICVIKTNDERCAFDWVDDDHTAFTITLYDKDNWNWEKEKTVCFQSLKDE